MKLGKAVYDNIVDPLIVPFGKHKGQAIETIDDGYLEWVTNQEWIHEKHPDFMREVEFEIQKRDSQSEECARLSHEADLEEDEYRYAYHEDVYDND